MVFRTAVVIASFLIGLAGLARESFAQYYPPQGYPPARDYPPAGYRPLPPVDADADALLPPPYYDLPAVGRPHTGAAGPSQVDPLAPGVMRGDQRNVAALPPEMRPETGPKKELPPQFRRTLVDYYTKEIGRHDRHRYAQHLSLSRARQRQGSALRHWGRPRRLHLVWRRKGFKAGGMARLEPTRTNDRAPALSAALYGRWRGQPSRGARALSGRHALPYSWYEPAVDHRNLRVLGLHPANERGHYGSLQASEGRHARGSA